jgi:hypothetical protein
VLEGRTAGEVAEIYALHDSPDANGGADRFH